MNYEYPERVRELLARARELRLHGEHVGAGDCERDAAALIRMAAAAEAVAAGTHYHHALTGRLLPRREKTT